MGVVVRLSYLIVIISISISFGANTEWVSKASVPSELLGREGLVGRASAPLRSLSITTEGLELRSLPGGVTGVKLPNARFLVGAGQPQLPFRVSQFEVPSGYRAVVQLSDVTWEESAGQVQPVSNPKEVYEWSPVRKLSFAPSAKGRFFPGQLYSARQTGNRLVVTLFPVQWDSENNKLLRMSGGQVNVTWEFDAQAFAWSGLGGTSSVIVTSEKLKDAADKLKKLHAERFGVRSQVVTVEEIKNSEEMVSEDQLPDGYKNLSAKDSFVTPFDAEKGTGYDYELARKITGYLQKAIRKGSLRYVTLLGTSSQVPPSYYFGVDNGGGGALFTPTDRCYGAIDKCLEGRVAVGRLPFSEESEVDNYLSKVRVWLDQRAGTELSLFGGHAFPSSDVYVGELGTLVTLNGDTSDWRSVKKFFQSRKTFNKKSVLELVSGKVESSLVYYLDHGNGNQWYVDTQRNQYVSSREILESEKIAGSVSPVIASIACTDGAFDDEITKEPILLAPERLGSVSVGVALLRAKAGSVVYVGSARPALGQPVYTIDNSGNVEVTGSNYGLQLLDNMIEKYRAARQGRMGDFFLKASQAYVSELGNDMKDSQHLWSYYLAVYLGDPLLPMPQRTTVTPVSALAKSLAAFENTMGFGIPTLKRGELKEFSLSMETGANSKATLYKVDRDWSGYSGEKEVSSVEVVSGKTNIAVPIEGESALGEYMLRVENAVGAPRERTVVFKVE